MWFKSFWRAIVWATIVFILSTMSGDSINKVKLINIPHFDKVVHFGFYFILTLLLLSGFHKWRSSSPDKKAYYISCVIAIMYGGVIELLQKHVFTNRALELFDFAANCAGTIIGVVAYSYLIKIIFVRKLL